MSKSFLLSGTEAAAEIRNSLKLKILDIQKNDPTFLPKLVIVQVPDYRVSQKMRISVSKLLHLCTISNLASPT